MGGGRVKEERGLGRVRGRGGGEVGVKYYNFIWWLKLWRATEAAGYCVRKIGGTSWEELLKAP